MAFVFIHGNDLGPRPLPDDAPYRLTSFCIQSAFFKSAVRKIRCLFEGFSLSLIQAERKKFEIGHATG
ncbi:MAG TPA: hypothetical protein DD376_02760 [Sutterella sp.]|nr:hypothetical protein [Sutterella sp.]